MLSFTSHPSAVSPRSGHNLSLCLTAPSQAIKVVAEAGDLREAQFKVPLLAIPAFDRIAGLSNTL
jgi:hypothetical protein